MARRMKRAGKVGLVCAWVAAGMAALASWSWGAGVADLLTTAGHRPTGPAAALLLAWISPALLLLRLWPQQRAVVRFGYGTGIFVLVAGWLVAVRHWFGWASPVEEWLARTLGQGLDPKGFQMASLAGVLLVGVAVGFLLRLPPLGRRPEARRISGAVGGVVALAGAVMAANYALAEPWLVGGLALPMALWTTLIFLFLGVALLAFPDPDHQPAETRSDALAYGTAGVPLAIFSLLALAIAALGALYLRQEQAEIRDEAHETLQAVARLKALELSQWRQERLGDARFFAKAVVVARDTQTFLDNPASEPARAELLHWLTLLKAGDRYATVRLYDTNLVLRLAVPEHANAPSAYHRELLAAALCTNQVIMTDLHHGGEGRDIHLEMLFTIFAPGTRAATSAPPQPLGAVLIRVDPRQFLYPLIRSWPTPSASAETLLVRRDGNEVVFLNELRHGANTALQLRLPLNPESRVPAAMAALGRTGSVEGLDYRGAPVLATILPFPELSWFIIAKVDQAEIYAPLRHQAWLVLALTVVLAAAAGLLVWLLSKRRETANAQQELATERQRRILAERVEHLMKSANDVILLADEQWRILEANDRALEAYGYSLAELQRMSLADLRAPEARAAYSDQAARLLAEGRIRFETIHQRKDGSTFLVENSARIVEIGGVRYYLAILRDITARKQAEHTLRESERLLRTVIDVVPHHIFAKDRQGRFLFINRAAALACGREPEEMVGRLERDLRADTEHVEKFLRDDQEVLDRGTPKVIAEEPITHPDNSIHYLHTVKVPFTPPGSDERAVLGVAVDITDRKRAEVALRESEERYRLLADNVEDFVTVLDPREHRLYLSPSFFRVTGWTAEQVLGTAWDARLHPDDVPLIRRSRAANLAGQTTLIEHRVLCRDRSWMWVESRCKPVFGAAGRVRQILIWQHDITERKRAEEALRQSEARLRTLGDNLPGGALYQLLAPPDGRNRYTYMSAGIERLFGLPAGQVLADPAAFWELIVEADRPRLDAAQEQSARELSLFECEFRQRTITGELKWFHARSMPRRLDDGSILWDGVVADITPRKRAEQEREITVRLLSLLNASTSLRELLRDVTRLLADELDCEAVGIRLRDSDDFPYFETRGFPVEFVRLENQLCARDTCGDMVRDAAGNPVLECMCGNVLCGRFNPAKPFFTARGSFWTNCTTELLARTTEADRQARTRNRCNGEGYESVGLVALRAGGTTHGLLQLNDRRRDRFTPERLALLEHLADSLAVGIAHRQGREELRRSQRDLGRAQAVAKVGSWRAVLHGGEIVWSDETYRIFGLAPGTPMNHAAFLACVHPDDRELVDRGWQAALRGELYDLEHRIVVAGQVRWVRELAELEFNPHGAVVSGFGTVQDITESKLAEQAIQTLNAELEQRVLKRTAELEAANKELEAFSYSVSHDLRAPLRTMDGFAQALVEDHGPHLPETARRYLHLVRHGAQRMGRLIDDLLAFSRLSRQPLRKRTVDMAALVREGLKDLRTELDGRQVELDVGPLPSCQGDPALLGQVWLNLLANALKYTRRREGARVAVGCHTQDGAAVFYVRDNGTGFDMKYAHKLFGVFQRLHRAEDFEGTGVGLAIVQRVIHRHGGRVWAEAEPDRGATFYFTLENGKETDT